MAKVLGESASSYAASSGVDMNEVNRQREATETNQEANEESSGDFVSAIKDAANKKTLGQLTTGAISDVAGAYAEDGFEGVGNMIADGAKHLYSTDFGDLAGEVKDGLSTFSDGVTSSAANAALIPINAGQAISDGLNAAGSAIASGAANAGSAALGGISAVGGVAADAVKAGYDTVSSFLDGVGSNIKNGLEDLGDMSLEDFVDGVSVSTETSTVESSGRREVNADLLGKESFDSNDFSLADSMSASKYI